MLVRSDPKPHYDVVLEQSDNTIATADTRGKYRLSCVYAFEMEAWMIWIRDK